MSLITPDFGLLFWMLLCFGIVFGVLAKFGFPIITRSVEERREHIEQSLKAADEANQRLATVHAEADKLIQESQARQAEILKKAAADGEKIIQSAREKAEAETAKQMEIAKSQIETAKQKALGEIQSTVAMLSVEVSERILRAQLSDKNSSASFINKMIEEAENVAKENKA